MAAELDPGQQIKDPCVVDPDARYRGVENQLYRVEVHRGSGPDNSVTPTFKWSRDNGSVASAWLGTEGNDLVVASARGFSAGAWVELSDDRLELRGEPGVLVKVSSVDGNRLSIDPGSVPPSASLAWTAALQNPKVRRWDQTQSGDITLEGGAIPLVGWTDAEPRWIDLEDGLRVQFQPAAGDKQQYRSGDYWLIPARVATGDIEWPRHGDVADFLPPHGVEHHYAPLGALRWNAEKQELAAISCVCALQEINSCKRTPAERLVPAGRLAPGRPAAPQPAPTPGRPPTGGSRNPGRTPR